MLIGHKVQTLPLSFYSVPEVDPVGQVEARGAEQVPDAAEPVKEPECCPISLPAPAANLRPYPDLVGVLPITSTH